MQGIRTIVYKLVQSTYKTNWKKQWERSTTCVGNYMPKVHDKRWHRKQKHGYHIYDIWEPATLHPTAHNIKLTINLRTFPPASPPKQIQNSTLVPFVLSSSPMTKLYFSEEKKKKKPGTQKHSTSLSNSPEIPILSMKEKNLKIEKLKKKRKTINRGNCWISLWMEC